MKTLYSDIEICQRICLTYDITYVKISTSNVGGSIKMYETQKKAVIETALKIREYGLIALAGGNVSMRLINGDLLVTPSGTYYETMQESDVLLMDAQGNIKEGDLKPSVDTIALLYIYKNMPGLTDKHDKYNMFSKYIDKMTVVGYGKLNFFFILSC